MMDDNIANNIILSSGISLKEAFENEARAYKSNDQVIERLCYHSGKESRRNRRMLELKRKKGRIPSDKQKCQPKTQHEFTIKGVKIMAASKKDAIKKYNHRNK